VEAETVRILSASGGRGVMLGADCTLPRGISLLVDYLVNHARSFVFSASYGPAAALSGGHTHDSLIQAADAIAKIKIHLSICNQHYFFSFVF
jgi:7-keto-8-aminopelargonate synthetase-like enzyme